MKINLVSPVSLFLAICVALLSPFVIAAAPAPDLGIPLDVSVQPYQPAQIAASIPVTYTTSGEVLADAIIGSEILGTLAIVESFVVLALVGVILYMFMRRR